MECIMFKKEWTVLGILSACTVAVCCFACFYKQPDGTRVGWLAYVAIVAVVATLALPAFVVPLTSYG